MNLRFLNSELGVPIGTSNFKHGEGVAGVLGIAALAIGAFINAKTTEDTNLVNQRINQDNINAAEAQQLEAERYNSPMNQRAMLEEAGYSPYAYLQQSSNVGTTGIPSPVPMMRPDLGFDKMAQMLFELPGMQASVAKTESETSGINIENIIKQAEAKYSNEKQFQSMLETMHNAQKLGFEANYANMKNRLFDMTFQEQVENFYLNNEFIRSGISKQVADASYVTLQSLEVEKKLEYLPKLLDAQLRTELQRIDTLAAQAGAYNAQAKEAIESAFLNAAQRNKVGIESKRLSDTASAYVMEMQQNAILRKWQALGAKNTANNGFDPNFNVRNEDSLRGKVWRSTKYAGDVLRNIVPINIGIKPD